MKIFFEALTSQHNSNFCCIFQLKYQNFKNTFKKCILLADHMQSTCRWSDRIGVSIIQCVSGKFCYNAAKTVKKIEKNSNK